MVRLVGVVTGMSSGDQQDDSMALLDPIVTSAFGVQRGVQRLVGDEGCTYRAGDVVLRQEADPVWANWLADLFSGIVGDGFRVAQPLPARSGGWMAPGGWYAWTFLEGRHARGQDLPTVAPAISAFHAALADRPWPSYFRREESPFTRADRAAWGPVPTLGWRSRSSTGTSTPTTSWSPRDCRRPLLI